MEKRMVIMGATSGIGRKVAELYIGRGWRVGVAGRRVHLLEELKRINPDRVEYVRTRRRNRHMPRRKPPPPD